MNLTHFYIEINPAKKVDKYRNVRGLFKKKFVALDEILTEELLLFVGDFIPENFQINNSNSSFSFYPNKLVLPNFNKAIIPNRVDNQYCPLIKYDSEREKLTIFTDPFGLYYIYITVIDNSVILSSHLKYILDIHPELLLKLDYDAIIEYLFSHTILANKTLLYDIKLLPYNTKLNIDLTKSVELDEFFKQREMWFKFPEKYDKDINIEERADEISRLIQSLFDYLLKGTDRTKLSFLLSGGLDSTLLISALPKGNRNRVRALTFDSSLTGKEATIANNTTNILNIEHLIEIVDEKTVVEKCYKHLWINEGLSYNIASVLISLLENHPLRNQIYIDGFAGDTQLGGEFLTNIEKIAKSNKTQAVKCQTILTKHEYSFPKNTFIPLINENHERIDALLENGFREHCENLWNTNDEILFLENMLFFTRIRHYTLGGTRTCMDFAPILMPFYHPEIFNAYIALPPKQRKRRKMQKRILAKLNENISKQSSVSKIWYNRFASTFLIQFGLKIARKLEGIFKRRILPIYSSLPYHEWLRNKNVYFDIVQELFGERSLVWNVLDKKETQKLFRDFINRKNHLHKFIMHIVDLEIYLRLLYTNFKINNGIKMVSSSLNEEKDFIINLNLDSKINFQEFS